MKKSKGTNQGFTLIELIIVIAIIAALVGLLAPQYLKYVEKSRRATCDTNRDNLRTAYYAEVASMADFNFAENLKTVVETNGYQFASESDGNNSYKMSLDGLCPDGGVCSIIISKDTGTVTIVNCTVHGPTEEETLTMSKDSILILQQAFDLFAKDNPSSSWGGSNGLSTFDSNGTRLTPTIKNALASLGYTVSDNTMWKIVAKSATEYCIYMVDLTDDQMSTIQNGSYGLTAPGNQVYFKDGEVVSSGSIDCTIQFGSKTANETTYPVISNSPALYK